MLEMTSFWSCFGLQFDFFLHTMKQGFLTSTIPKNILKSYANVRKVHLHCHFYALRLACHKPLISTFNSFLDGPYGAVIPNKFYFKKKDSTKSLFNRSAYHKNVEEHCDRGFCYTQGIISKIDFVELFCFQFCPPPIASGCTQVNRNKHLEAIL